ncbi:MAG: hypothetical protein ACREF4_17875 [Gammaproteobacteria bacterium]
MMKAVTVALIVAITSLTIAGEKTPALDKEQIVYLPGTIHFSYVLPQNFPAELLGSDAKCSALLCDWTYRACDPLQVVSIGKRRTLITLDLPVSEKYKEVGTKRVGVPFGLSGEWARVVGSDRDACLELVGAVEVVETETDRPKGYHLGVMKGLEVYQGEYAVRIAERH